MGRGPPSARRIAARPSDVAQFLVHAESPRRERVRAGPVPPPPEFTNSFRR